MLVEACLNNITFALPEELDNAKGNIGEKSSADVALIFMKNLCNLKSLIHLPVKRKKPSKSPCYLINNSIILLTCWGALGLRTNTH